MAIKVNLTNRLRDIKIKDHKKKVVMGERETYTSMMRQNKDEVRDTC